MILGVEIIIWTYFESILLGVNFPIFGHFREFTRPQWALWGSLRGRYLGFVYYSNGLSRKWSGFEKFHFWLEGFRCLLAAMHVKSSCTAKNKKTKKNLTLFLKSKYNMHEFISNRHMIWTVPIANIFFDLCMYSF